MNRSEILHWLRESDDRRLEVLWRLADDARRRNVGDAVHLRGLVEFSNHCRRRCHYCGLRADHAAVRRYRMTADEILACARQAVVLGYGTVVLQSGEDPGMSAEWLAQVVRRIKRETPLAVTLSVGERTPEELALWRAAGADRYLLRFETSNAALYERIHPSLPGEPSDRFALLAELRRLGYEVGSGVMIGIPGQTLEDLARDIELFAELDLDMIGVGPYIPHPATPLAEAAAQGEPGEDQAPNTEQMTYKVVALARLVAPLANIPSTTALATLNLAQGRELGLMRGANVIMPNLTPPEYRAAYEIYPAKACLAETAERCGNCVEARIASIGRSVGVGRGDSLNGDRRGGAVV
ncbi:MAG: [FeFe] hydrogenase H-cluster radical SAM maturase HydE [Pirellulales bacterium]